MFQQIINRLDRIEQLLQTLIGQEKSIMASITDLANEVTQETTLETSLETLLSGIQAQLTAALANTITPAQQAVIDSTFAQLQTNVTTLTTAVAANTPAAPPVTSTVAPTA